MKNIYAFIGITAFVLSGLVGGIVGMVAYNKGIHEGIQKVKPVIIGLNESLYAVSYFDYQGKAKPVDEPTPPLSCAWFKDDKDGKICAQVNAVD